MITRPTRRFVVGKGWFWVIAFSLGLSMALLLLFLLAQATQDWQAYERYYNLLLGVNLATVVTLLTLVGWMVWRLGHRLRQGKFGTRLLIKLAAIFALVGVMPGIVIYTVSYQFVTRSIEVWFDDKVDHALNAGLSLSRTTLDLTAQEVVSKSKELAQRLRQTPDAAVGPLLEVWLEQIGANDLILWSNDLLPVAAAGQSRYQLAPPRPNALDIRQANVRGVLWRFDGLEDSSEGSSGNNPPSIRVLLALPQPGMSFGGTGRLLQVVLRIPEALVDNARALVQANREYQERALGREGLRRMYLGTLTLSLILGVFGAVLLAVLLGNQLARPLLLLAEGVRDVAAGDLSPKRSLEGQDELDGLTRSFAKMTRQLLEARQTIEQSLIDLELARGQLQAILDNMSAGVLILAPNGRIADGNPAAARILQLNDTRLKDLQLAELPALSHFGEWVLSHFENHLKDRSEGGSDHWQSSLELDELNKTVLLARGAVLPTQQWLLVFDDITQVAAAQRTRAWGEVARRLAHEIKNPLTPIQLSAERMAMKLEAKLQGPDQALLLKSVKTIVDQVDAMQRLVNEFRDYARLPQAQLTLLDLNSLVSEVLMLYGVDGVPDWLRLELAEGLPPIRADAQQLRQVLHNLIQNAQEATPDLAHHPITLITDWRPAAQRVRLRILDQGQGFDDNMLSRAFEPYVTTKAKGTGLGLAVVKKILEEHGARITLNNRSDGTQISGAEVSLSFPAATAHTEKG